MMFVKVVWVKVVWVKVVWVKGEVVVAHKSMVVKSRWNLSVKDFQQFQGI